MTIPSHSSQAHKLTVFTGDEEREVHVTSELMSDAATLLARMDHDMDQGGQLSRRFIPSPNLTERCQIVANRLLTALHTQNDASVTLMTAYLLSRLPELKSVSINIEGEAEETLFYDHNNAVIQ